VLGVQAANESAVSSALLSYLKTLLQPVFNALYPQGALGGNLLDKPPYRALLNGSTASSSSTSLLTARGPALDPRVFELLSHLKVYSYREPEVFMMLLRVLKHELAFYGGMLLPGGAAANPAAAADGIGQQQQQQQLLLLPIDDASIARVSLLLLLVMVASRWLPLSLPGVSATAAV
jgi:hypothetical protein